MRIAIMQPYFFPYIGYFQLIKAVDKFIFYDDVNYIVRGWINRNRILLHGKEHLITIPCIKASQNKLINEIELDTHTKLIVSCLKTIEVAYKKAPFYEKVFPLVTNVLSANCKTIDALAQQSIIAVCAYLNIKTEFLQSSVSFPETKGLEKEQRLIAICENIGADSYINPVGGQALYSKEAFKRKLIDLFFIISKEINYRQFSKDFIPWLSIIDVMMFNSIPEIHGMLDEYQLV